MEELLQKLRGCKDRKEATDMLKGLKKTELDQLAIRLYLPRKLNKAAVTERIVESTVGSRLRSEAIASIKLK